MEKESGVIAKDILSKRVVSVRKNEKIGESIKTMRKHGYSQLPVLDRNRVIGTISEKSILDTVSEGRNLSDILTKNVESVMTESLPRISEDESIGAVSALLKNNSAVLVTKKGKIMGIITKTDLFKTVKKK